MNDLTTPLMNYVQAVKEHLQLQAKLRDTDFQLEKALENREKPENVNSKCDKMASLIRETERASQAVHQAYDTAIAALDDGLASTAQSGITRMAGNWLQSKRAEIQRYYSAQEARK